MRERAEVIKRVRSNEFWDGVTFDRLEDIREPLRQIMHHRDRPSGQPMPPKLIDVTETDGGIQTNRRATSLKTVDMKAYKQVVEAELKKHFETDPTLRKIWSDEPVTESDIDALKSLVLAQTPNIDRAVLEEFFSETAKPLDFLIREIIGLDPEAVAKRFAEFAGKHPALTAKQTRFLGLLQNHIAKFGSITVDRLYEQPFTVVDADGLDGVFESPDTIDELLKVVERYAPPRPVGTEELGSSERTKH